MHNYTLTIVDVSAIQDYIFRSNHLKQIIGASYLVECAVRKWVASYLPGRNNVKIIENDEFTGETIERDGLRAEIIYVGGGNAVIIFADHEEALSFSRRLSRKVLEEAPGLRIAIAHQDFDWNAGQLNEVLAQTQRRLAGKKADPPPSAPLLGLGVTAGCVFTGLPAVGNDPEGRLISHEGKAKLAVFDQAEDRLTKYLKLNSKEYRTIRNFDDLGTRGEKSFLALVHTDGNGMARRFHEAGKSCPDNRQWILKQRELSASVHKAAREALLETVKLLTGALQQENGHWSIGGVLGINRGDDGRLILPFRPLVFGGDDLTFVCDGRLGLQLTACYLKHFSQHTLADGKPASARAGVAVVKTHFPVAYAYSLAEELCRSAKKYIHEADPDAQFSALDWHFATSGQVRGLAEIREQDYKVKIRSYDNKVEEFDLSMRPVRIDAGDWRSWPTFMRIVSCFQKGEWAGRRNKVKKLREALRKGPEATKMFIETYVPEGLPVVDETLKDMPRQGFQMGRCAYFDAIEAMDFVIPLGGSEL
ncbi:MAG: hypothetical protein K6U04_12590 [Armatimonadetes bacterium]|nr:hypothetical protein [Armatimonadota bacterium]